ncbi:hypothetical protein AAB992_14115 [Burkholderia contaminans]|nr:hypothetical protein [Burkholderia contaminans]WFN14391.1 hypothetical protein LXE92_36400 [Burkholderia contaminans]
MTRLREVVSQIADLAERSTRPAALAEIARLARNALIASTPVDSNHSHDTDHG